jgi:hypothetical protein
VGIDSIYKGKTREEIIQMIYDLTLQNTNGRESEDEMYMKGIEACYEELCGGLPSDTDSNCNIQHVMCRCGWFSTKFNSVYIYI